MFSVRPLLTTIPLLLLQNMKKKSGADFDASASTHSVGRYDVYHKMGIIVINLCRFDLWDI